MINLGLLTFECRQDFDISKLFEYAIKADDLNFSRFWLGEHFDSPSLWSNPEPLIPVLLGLTDQIKVGAAGIILRLHSSFRVANSFKFFNAIYPDRVDLGLAGGHTSNIATLKLTGLTKAEAAKVDFNAKVEEIISYYNNEKKHMEEELYITPTYFSPPSVWLLGSTLKGFDYATNFGTNYSISMIHRPESFAIAKDEINRKRDAFYKIHGWYPTINVAFAGICAKDEKEAQRLYQKSYLNNSFLNANLLGNINLFQDKLYEYQESIGIDEFIFLDMTPAMSHRMETLEQLSKAFNLKTSTPETPIPVAV